MAKDLLYTIARYQVLSGLLNKYFVFLAILVISIGVSRTLLASDMLVNNHSFEAGTTGWAQSFGLGGISVSVAQKYDGDHSLKLVDTSNLTSQGMESEKIEVLAGITYVLGARIYIVSGSAELYLRFWDSDGRLVSSSKTLRSSPTGRWTTISLSAKAPQDATYASILLYCSCSNVGTVYYDSIGITKDLTVLDAQVTSSECLAGAFGKDESGRDVLYTVINGAPGYSATFCRIDLDTLAVEEELKLFGACGAWALTVASDGKVYMGSYPNGSLYRYVPALHTLEKLGKPSSSGTYIWDLQPGWNGKVYGGTYPNGCVFKYDKGTFSVFGPNGAGKPFDLNEDYVRSIAYDSTHHVLYAGLGSHAKLYRFDCNSGRSDSILPSEYQNHAFVYNLNYIADKLFVKLAQPTNKALVLTISESSDKQVQVDLDTEIDNMVSHGVTPVFDDKVYYIRNYDSKYYLCYYDLANKIFDFVLDGMGYKVEIPFVGYGLTLMQLADQTDYPGFSFVAIGRSLGQTKVFKYNLTNSNRVVANLAVSSSPVSINSIRKGPDGKIYSSGYLTGGIGVYTPLRSDGNVEFKGMGQCENMISGGNKMYFGVYNNSSIYEYDPSIPWTMDTGGSNPKFLFDLLDNDQDRPFGLAFGDGRLIIGTVPVYGKLGGALVVYDVQSGGRPLVMRNLIEDQSIISLTYKEGIIYGGTSVSGGLGVSPTQESAKFFACRISDGAKLFELTPVPGKKAVTAVTVGPDGKIWGMVEGYLFIYNPGTGEIEFIERKFPTVDYSSADHVWRDGMLEAGKDRNVYGTIKGILFKINASTKAVTTLLANGANLFTQDDFGFLYFTNGTDLWRYAF